jgi:hypothetical protein
VDVPCWRKYLSAMAADQVVRPACVMSPASYRIERIAGHVLTPAANEVLANPVSAKKKLTLKDVEELIKSWVAAASGRDVKKIVALYDPEIGRLLGTLDEAATIHRSNPANIKDYFDHFLSNDVVKPMFPKFDAKDVIFLADDCATYNGYYVFELAKGGVTKHAFAKFSYIVRMTPAGVKIVTHNSGLTPTGIVVKK